MTARTCSASTAWPGETLTSFEHSAGRRDDGNFHFHRFHDDDHIVFIDMIADLFFDFQNFSHHGCFESLLPSEFSFFSDESLARCQGAPSIAI